MARVLIVDDSSFILTQMSQILIKGGHTVAGTAADGDQALAFLAGHSAAVDIVTLDVTMPGASGIEVLRRIAGSWPHIACLVVTGIGKKETVIESRELGAAGYLIKPLSSAKVLAKIDEVLQYRIG